MNVCDAVARHHGVGDGSGDSDLIPLTMHRDDARSRTVAYRRMSAHGDVGSSEPILRVAHALRELELPAGPRHPAQLSFFIGPVRDHVTQQVHGHAGVHRHEVRVLTKPHRVVGDRRGEHSDPFGALEQLLVHPSTAKETSRRCQARERNFVLSRSDAGPDQPKHLVTHDFGVDADTAELVALLADRLGDGVGDGPDAKLEGGLRSDPRNQMPCDLHRFLVCGGDGEGPRMG